MQLMEKELMSRDLVDFRITNLDLYVPGGLPVMWRGYKISTGPLDFGLDDSTGISCGGMNYELGVVSTEFHVLVRFHWFGIAAKSAGYRTFRARCCWRRDRLLSMAERN